MGLRNISLCSSHNDVAAFFSRVLLPPPPLCVQIERLNIMMGERLKSVPSLSAKPSTPRMSKKVESKLSWPDRMERACLTGDMPLLNQTLFHVGVEDNLRADWFPAAMAAAAGHPTILAELLRLGADPERKMIDGSTPLRLAASAGHVTCVQELLKVHAEADILVAAEQAANNGKLATFKRLMDHRSNLLHSVPHGCLQRLCAATERTREVSTLTPQLRNGYRRVRARLTSLNDFEQVLCSPH